MKVNRSIFVYIAISIILGMTGIMMWNNFNLMTWLLILELIVFLITAKINGYLMSVGAMFLVFVFFSTARKELSQHLDLMIRISIEA